LDLPDELLLLLCDLGLCLSLTPPPAETSFMRSFPVSHMHSFI
jgi:hypothetical protein